MAPERFLRRYPHELSGGQRQRVAIAATLVLEPAGIICDEPVSMLDVSVRSQILHVLLELQQARELALLFITHDLSLAWQLCDRIAVMYLGRIVEQGDARDVIERPGHPYTQALVDAVPPRKQRTPLGGELPDAAEPPGRLPLPPALPEALRALRPRGPAAFRSRRSRPRGGLPAAQALALRSRTCYLFPRLPTGLVGNRSPGALPHDSISPAVPRADPRAAGRDRLRRRVRLDLRRRVDRQGLEVPVARRLLDPAGRLRRDHPRVPEDRRRRGRGLQVLLRRLRRAEPRRRGRAEGRRRVVLDRARHDAARRRRPRRQGLEQHPEQGSRHDLRRLLHRPQGQPEEHQDVGRPAQAGRAGPHPEPVHVGRRQVEPAGGLRRQERRRQEPRGRASTT